MTDQVTKIIGHATKAERAMPCQEFNTGWLLWIISDHEAYWIHTKTDTVVPSARNY